MASCVVAAAGDSGLWLDVPFVHQAKDGCGSASLAMVLQYWKSKNYEVAAERMDPAAIQHRAVREKGARDLRFADGKLPARHGI